MSHKVMHICLSSGWGGLEMYPSRIIPELEHQGWEVHGMALAGSRVADSLRAAGVTPLTVASRGQALLATVRILSYLRRHHIQVLHCHKSSDLRLAALLKSLRPGLRLFFTEHMGVTRPKKGLYHRWAYGKLSRLFSISEATRARNLKAFALPPERIQRLYLGIDPAPYAAGDDSQALRGELGTPQGALLIGLPGRLTPGKGQDLWLEALARLAERAPALPWHAAMIGGLTASEGSDEAYVAELEAKVTALGLNERVSFAGFRSDLPRLLGTLDIVCIPSTNEAFGLTVIEAMAAGRPVIGADSGAIPELLDSEVGRLAAPDDPDAWARQLEALASDPGLRQRLGKAAAERVLRDFTLSAHVAALCTAYTISMESA
ncbi:Glycosyltransferase involved in cell wall bisynthesis [Franzmannia pantelleriensis]|uniref:Glycosyltransferase involved in cell wall bisynthesis n=1 Tax=Franzmannia pantelleriensis TaxID=48727 RepID=A0A1G9LAH8_9GAMM|nr:glycosyltransferase family 4 protein [Halomonas pantelleriensis]SDL58747.1 Glycosyltransferase involved in cell wall bisynthesis [Halomonas pantelleriensis]